MIIEFEVSNGVCVKPRYILPAAYRATFKNMKLVKLECCWSKENYEKYAMNQYELEKHDERLAFDFKHFKLLRKSLKRLAWKSLIKLNKKKFEIDESRWVYKTFWEMNK